MGNKVLNAEVDKNLYSLPSHILSMIKHENIENVAKTKEDKDSIREKINIKWKIIISIIMSFVAYFILAIAKYSLFSDLALAIGAGLLTGLVIYAMTNHRSNWEKELIEIRDLSQKAIDSYYQLYRFLLKNAKISLNSNENKDKDDILINLTDSYIDFISYLSSLSSKEHKKLVKLSEIKKKYLDPSFVKHMSETFYRVKEPANYQEYEAALYQFTKGTEDMRDLLYDTKLEVEDYLKILHEKSL